MCYVIYVTLLALALYTSDHLLDQHILAASSEAGEIMIIAQGWEIAVSLWPVFLLAATVGSAATFFIVRFKSRK